MDDKVTLNGVDFLIFSESDGGGYYGGWFCCECSRSGKSNHKDPTPERAKIAAKVGASFHAGAMHPEMNPKERTG